MKILITNDDGLHAPGLIPLIQWAQKLGQVTAIVPKYEQSGKSQGIELHKAFEVKTAELAPGITVTSVDSTPADCIRYAILGLQGKFDLVISGINRGLNMGTDMQYSGTVGAVLESGHLGVPAIALSTSPSAYDGAISQLDAVWEFFQVHKLLKLHNLYNVNIPADAKGIRITRQGGPYYSDDFIHCENDMVKPCGKEVYAPTADMNIDTNAVLRGGYISIMPLTLQKTDMHIYQSLLHLNDNPCNSKLQRIY